MDSFSQSARETDVLARIVDRSQMEYDVVLFDTPAGLGGMTRLALEAVESVIAVAQCEPLALRALPRLLELLAQLREAGHECSLLGVVGNMSSFRDPVVLRTEMAGFPVFLGLATAPDGILRMKPQNLLMNLPLARPA